MTNDFLFDAFHTDTDDPSLLGLLLLPLLALGHNLNMTFLCISFVIYYNIGLVIIFILEIIYQILMEEVRKILYPYIQILNYLKNHWDAFRSLSENKQGSIAAWLLVSWYIGVVFLPASAISSIWLLFGNADIAAGLTIGEYVV